MEQNTTPNKRELEIDLVAIAKKLWQKLYIIAGVTVVAAALAFALTFILIRPTYQSRFTAYVNNKIDASASLTSSDLSASHSIANTYAEIIKSRSVLTSAAQNAGLNVSYGTLSSAVSVKVASNTQIMTISVVMTDKQKAFDLALALSEMIPGYASQIVEGSSMKIIDTPFMPTSRYAPNYMRNAVLGAILGFLIICIVLVLRELFDTRVKSAKALEDSFSIPVIGIIPDYELAAKVGSKYGKYGYGYESAAKKGEEENDK